MEVRWHFLTPFLNLLWWRSFIFPYCVITVSAAPRKLDMTLSFSATLVWYVSSKRRIRASWLEACSYASVFIKQREMDQLYLPFFFSLSTCTFRLRSSLFWAWSTVLVKDPRSISLLLSLPKLEPIITLVGSWISLKTGFGVKKKVGNFIAR